MIITCINCSKKFDLDPDLIPINGRLLQCSSCNHKWFFKKEILNPSNEIEEINRKSEEINKLNEEITAVTLEKTKKLEIIDEQIKPDTSDEVDLNKSNDENELSESAVTFNNYELSNSKNKKGYNILGSIIVLIISFIAIIIMLDTFQSPISNIAPDIEFILYNLYQTINDIGLFIKDLI